MLYKTLTILALSLLVSVTSSKVSSSSLSSSDKALVPTSLNEVEISPYDNIFRSISEKEGNDWRLLCAMAYHESRFRADVVSHCGATGIMQVMPRVASQFDVDVEQLKNIDDNIYVANKLVTLIEDMLGLPDVVSPDDKIRLTLAAYNCGIGRIADARRLAKSFGEEATSWDVISKYLVKMNSPEYYNHNVVKYGRFTGAGQTLAYVKNVVNHYEDYCSMVMR